MKLIAALESGNHRFTDVNGLDLGADDNGRQVRIKAVIELEKACTNGLLVYHPGKNIAEISWFMDGRIVPLVTIGSESDQVDVVFDHIIGGLDNRCVVENLTREIHGLIHRQTEKTDAAPDALVTIRRLNAALRVLNPLTNP